MTNNHSYFPGDVVHVIIRNPHAQDIANVQQAAVVQDPDNPSELALFFHESYYPLSDDFAIYATEEEAESVYTEAFGFNETEEFYG